MQRQGEEVEERGRVKVTDGVLLDEERDRREEEGREWKMRGWKGKIDEQVWSSHDPTQGCFNLLIVYGLLSF